MKSKIFNAYSVFIAGLLLVTGVTFVKLDCPVCQGSGRVTGISGVEIASVKANLVSHKELAIDCGWDYERFIYDMELTVENYTGSTAAGVVLVTFHDPDETYTIQVEENDEEIYVDVNGSVLLSYPWIIEVPARITQVFTHQVTFDGITLEFFGGRHHLVVANTNTSYPCPFHELDETKVSFPEWLRLR